LLIKPFLYAVLTARLRLFMVQSWAFLFTLQKMYEMVAHFSETLAYFFSSHMENDKLCSSF